MRRPSFTRRGLFAVALVVAAAACSGPPAAQPPVAGARSSGASTRSTTDARVRSFVGRTPPDVFTDGNWVGPAGSTSLAALRGRVVYLQFAFPQ